MLSFKDLILDKKHKLAFEALINPPLDQSPSDTLKGYAAQLRLILEKKEQLFLDKNIKDFPIDAIVEILHIKFDDVDQRINFIKLLAKGSISSLNLDLFTELIALSTPHFRASIDDLI